MLRLFFQDHFKSFQHFIIFVLLFKVVELLMQSERTRELLHNTQDDMLDNDRTTCLHLAARNGHIEVIRYIQIKSGKTGMALGWQCLIQIRV